MAEVKSCQGNRAERHGFARRVEQVVRKRWARPRLYFSLSREVARRPRPYREGSRQSRRGAARQRDVRSVCPHVFLASVLDPARGCAGLGVILLTIFRGGARERVRAHSPNVKVCEVARAEPGGCADRPKRLCRRHGACSRVRHAEQPQGRPLGLRHGSAPRTHSEGTYW